MIASSKFKSKWFSWLIVSFFLFISKSREWKEKFDLVDNDEVDTLKYHYKNVFKFRRDLSGPGLTGDEIITMPHPCMHKFGLFLCYFRRFDMFSLIVITSTLLTLNIDKKALLPILNSAIEILFNSPQHMYYTGRVMDILFDGIPIDCSSDKFEAQAVCSVLGSGEFKAIRPLNSTHYAFSLLAQGNGTDLGEITVFRGKKNSQDLGRVVAFNDESEMSVWKEDECNEFIGTDSTIFPPFMDVNKSIWVSLKNNSV